MINKFYIKIRQLLKKILFFLFSENSIFINIFVHFDIFLRRLGKMTPKELDVLIKYALLYPPRVRALLGALLEQLDVAIDIKELKNSLNPLTIYRYNLRDTTLTTQPNWNIV